MYPDRNIFTLNMLVLLGSTVLATKDEQLLRALVTRMTRFEDRKKFDIALAQLDR